jgi:hypothetical protein
MCCESSLGHLFSEKLSQLSWMAAYEVVTIWVLLSRPQRLKITDNTIKAMDLCHPAVAFPLLGPQGPCSGPAQFLQILMPDSQVFKGILEISVPFLLILHVTLEVS